MKEITDITEFANWLFEVEADSKFDEHLYKKNHYSVGSEMLEISGLKVDEKDIENKHFQSTRFINCNFKNTKFNSTIFGDCEFIDCHFIGCELGWSKLFDVELRNCLFIYCTISGLELNDTESYNTKFENCNEIADLIIRGFGNRDLAFSSSYLFRLNIEPIQKQHSDRIVFEDCVIEEASFNRIVFSESQFIDSSLSLNKFNSCTFTSETFVGENSTPGDEFNLVDIRTILNSSPLDNEILKSLFGIHNSEIKEYLHDLTAEIKFQSVFISYSFEDKKFANAINNILKKKGVFTFLWEKDSIGGEGLDYIMKSNINEKDRVLFIASENSIKSKACQFELSQGQKKQEIIWKDVLFPIHVDDFLFKVTKEQIRPVEKQEEYWSNISELKKLNSLNFSDFYEEDHRNSHEFEQIIFRLLKGLRK